MFLALRKPNNALKDADHALAINSESARGRKVRGKALAMLGRWEEALKDLKVADQLDFDPDTRAVLKKVLEKTAKIDAKRTAKRLRQEENERKKKEAKYQHDLKERAKRIKKQQKEQEAEVAHTAYTRHSLSRI